MLSGYRMVDLILHSMYTLAMQEGERERAHMLVDKRKELAGIFEMGRYSEISPALVLAHEEKDEEAMAELAEELLENVGTLMDLCRSPLYEHLSLRPAGEEALEKIREELTEGFRKEFGALP